MAQTATLPDNITPAAQTRHIAGMPAPTKAAGEINLTSFSVLGACLLAAGLSAIVWLVIASVIAF